MESAGFTKVAFEQELQVHIFSLYLELVSLLSVTWIKFKSGKKNMH